MIYPDIASKFPESVIFFGEFSMSNFNHFIDIPKGRGMFDDYDGYSYENGSGKNVLLDQTIFSTYLSDEYIHAPGHPDYRLNQCSIALELYSN